MKRFWMFLILLLGTCSGCAAMEDLVFGPEPYPPVNSAPTGSCGMPPPNYIASQTAEPELIQVRK